MALTTAQATVLRNAINADATVAAPLAAKDWPTIANNYNATAAPVVQVWNPNVRADVIMSAIVPADFIALTVQGGLGMLCMLSAGFVDATSANVQTWFNTAFSGKATTLAQLQAAGQRPCTKFEGLFTVSNVTTLYGYILGAEDVRLAMGF